MFLDFDLFLLERLRPVSLKQLSSPPFFDAGEPNSLATAQFGRSAGPGDRHHPNGRWQWLCFCPSPQRHGNRVG